MARTPDDPTKAQVWADQVGNALKFEFFIPRGPKGDPGGIVLGTQMGNGADLNTFTTDGYYRFNGQAGLLNMPSTAPVYGLLHVANVEAVGSRVIQTIYPATVATAGRIIYQRTNAGGTWQPWRTIGSQRVDQSAGRAIYAWDDVNGREQLVWGDTGVRRIESLFTNGWTASIAALRREGAVVTLGLYSVNPAAQTAAAAVNIPAGFRPGPYGGNIGIPAQTNSAVSWIMLSAAGDLMPPTTGVSAQGFIHILTWITGDTWPTSLPGTASGSVNI